MVKNDQNCKRAQGGQCKKPQRGRGWLGPGTDQCLVKKCPMAAQTPHPHSDKVCIFLGRLCLVNLHLLLVGQVLQRRVAVAPLSTQSKYLFTSKCNGNGARHRWVRNSALPKSHLVGPELSPSAAPNLKKVLHKWLRKENNLLGMCSRREKRLLQKKTSALPPKGGNRKYVLFQLPKRTDWGWEARRGTLSPG